MRVRDARTNDLDALRSMYERMAMEYALPTENLAVAQVVVDAEDRPVAAVLARKTVEIYLLLGVEGAVAKEAVLTLHGTAERELVRQGYTDVHAWLPPEVAGFGRRLRQWFGWERNDWACWSKQIGGR